ncbi:MAG: high frequency lysogenization protein HflD [Paraglaciecola sp.]|uniref:high frequency lysogenization protein HflD n=1 Tax=Paraglaciecola sp. TaxID=1920173 RepID=UPI00273EBC69|nr:high frequency lysogenization protein HflD [Paraglaciecola sp.]MDP5031742.1 high frequency lysogenization protein HflD [Paraglaciecola sp.]MDP5132885.1 high frequency lysogenization protein HflD [Paraglaciecola sp.]
MTNEKHQFYNRNLALAGVCQAAALVKQVARTGEVNEKAFNASINSIVITTPQNTIDVFGSLGELYLGFSTLINQLGNDDKLKDIEITRYVANLLTLERKVSGNKKVMQSLGDRVGQIQRQQLHMDILDGQMMSNLAAIYSDVISPVGRKIQIAGTPALLKRNDNQHKVRACLLAGLRAAVLWRQLGGKRRQILFSRQSILRDAKLVLNQSTTVN